MKAGDLVIWSSLWIRGCSAKTRETYEKQVGLIIKYSSDIPKCWIVVWNGGEIDEVHEDYLEVMDESR
jgi:hypothetical protein